MNAFLSKENKLVREKDHAKFVELAEKRVTRALSNLRLIGNLANKSNYSYTEEDAKKICKTLQDAVSEVRDRFHRQTGPSSQRFKL